MTSVGYLLNRLSGAATMAATSAAECQESDESSDDGDESDLDIGVEEQTSLSHQSQSPQGDQPTSNNQEEQSNQ